MHANIVPFGKFVKSMISGVCWLKTVRFCYSGYISLQGSVDMLPQFVLLTAVLVCTWVNISCYFSGKKKSTVFFWKKKKKINQLSISTVTFLKKPKTTKISVYSCDTKITYSTGREGTKQKWTWKGRKGRKERMADPKRCHGSQVKDFGIPSLKRRILETLKKKKKKRLTAAIILKKFYIFCSFME